MPDYLIEEPYKFLPRFKPEWIQRCLVRTGLLELVLRMREQVTDYEIQSLALLRQSLDAGQAVLLVPNHSSTADPLVLQYVARDVGQPFYFMASRHVFHQGLLQRLILRWVGGFSVNREGIDRRAIDEALEILQTAERPLVMFPEGTTSRTNDLLMEFLEGSLFIARRAAIRRQKNSQPQVVCHPIAIHYQFAQDFQSRTKAMLSELEQRLGWRRATAATPLDRLNQISQAMVTLRELEFGLKPDCDQALFQRRQRLINHILQPLERQWLHESQVDQELNIRIKNLTAQIFPDLAKKALEKQELEHRRRLVEHLDLARQLGRHPNRYIEDLPSNERIAETLENLHEELTGIRAPAGSRKASIEIGAAIPVPAHRCSVHESDSCLSEIRTSIQTMLDRMARQSTPDNMFWHSAEV
ncbi:MAG: 1-acyl-sn-glycerol-3-phosphate acyltransferase [bacterium]|nr:1-acyl-sn-glycerol-3-phosphate acyltransferase [bacterium]